MSSALSVAAALSAANALKVLKKDQLKAEEKALDTQYKNDQAIYNYNKDKMALTANQTKLNELYQKNFGRDASFGTKGGASYWLDTHGQGDNVDWDNIDRMLGGSDEGKKFAASGISRVGGIDASKSISSQAGPGTWASHFAPGGKFANEDAAGAASAIAKDIGFGTKKDITETVTDSDGATEDIVKTITETPKYFNTGVTDQTGSDNTGTTVPPEVAAQPDGWWNQFADADAFKKFLGEGQETKSDGMGDFMKFMMLMNVMRPGGQGGYGGGGSQYGYGGLNPGGVQSAYDPMASLTGMGDWFKKNFGSGGSTTATVNTD